LLPNPENSGSPLISSFFINKPTKYDQSYQTVQIDSLCNGMVTSSTPPAAIKEATLVEFHSLNPTNSSWENPVQAWARSDEAKERYGSVYNMVTSISNEVCQRNENTTDVTIASNLKN
jgi:hypothetical protein